MQNNSEEVSNFKMNKETTNDHNLNNSKEDEITNLSYTTDASLNFAEKVLDAKIILESLKLSNIYSVADKIKSEEQETESNINLNKTTYNFDLLLTSQIFFLTSKKITKIANLEPYSNNLEELYLQRNCICKIEGLEFLKKLQILNLSDNYIRSIENLKHLKELKILQLSDNLIHNFDISSLPTEISYLYLYDNLFYDELNILKFRSICIQSLNKLVRLDYLTISDLEKFILMDEGNIKNKYALRKLKYITKHYEDFRKERKTLLEESKYKFDDGDSILNQLIKKRGDSNIAKNDFSKNTEISITQNSEENSESKENLNVTPTKNQQMDLLKIRSHKRVKEFEESSDERMKELKGRLDDIRNKFKNMPIIDDERKDKIKNKIDNAIKVEEKMKKAESISQKLLNKKNSSRQEREGNKLINLEESRNENTNNEILPQESKTYSDIGQEILNSPVPIDNQCSDHYSIEDNQPSILKDGSSSVLNSEMLNQSHDNSLLSDMSDLSFIKMKNKKCI